MNEITLNETDGIYVEKIDFLTANTPFFMWIESRNRMS